MKKRLEMLARRTQRSKSFPAAEAIARSVEAEEWPLGEIQAALKDLDQGRHVNHEKISQWMRSWGKRAESKVPR
jgi:predicted transcriptional regulator